MAKRMVDLVVGTCLAVLSLPAIVVLAVAVAISLRAWPFFVHERVGHRGRLFRFVKLRTLPPATSPYAAKYALSLDTVPPFARWLRRTHLDELPQLLLVPLGHMSLVGPRPEMPGLHATLDPRLAEARVSVRPGCTGLWQIGTDCHRLIGESPEYDLYYVGASALPLDAWIIARTIWLMIAGRGHIRLEDIPAWATRRPAPADLMPAPARALPGE
jgi:lipopolysaccharide/colanic/teichoic acid biosynthesis glycosyltransferase